MTLALADPDTNRRVYRVYRSIHLDDLTPEQADRLNTVLTLLGTADGLVEDEPPVIDPKVRWLLSDGVAEQIDLTLTVGGEIARCNNCPLVMDAEDSEEDDGRIRCADCRTVWQATLDEGPDTTRDTW